MSQSVTRSKHNAQVSCSRVSNDALHLSFLFLFNLLEGKKKGKRISETESSEVFVCFEQIPEPQFLQG